MSPDRGAACIDTSHLLSGGGELGARMRAYDWGSSPLGAVTAWPQPLKTLVGVMLAASQPMFVAWGSERILLYNDAYSTLMVGRHPAALGRPFFEVWHDIVDEIEPLFERVFAGEPVHMEDIELRPKRPGRPLEAHFAFSYTPVRDEADAIAGLFCVCTEITEQVFADRRRRVLFSLEERLRNVADVTQISYVASELLGEALGAVRVAYGVLDPEAQAISIGVNWSKPGFTDVTGVHRFADYGSHIEDLLRGEVVANADVASDPRTAATAMAFEKLGVRAHLDVPILEDGRAVAEMFVHADQPRTWEEHEIALVREVTERIRATIARRQAERDLQTSRLRLANALASARLGTFEWKLGTGQVDMDGQARAIFGFSPDEPITDRQVFDRIAPDQAQSIEASATNAVAKGEHYSTTYDIALPGGVTRFVSSSGVLIEGPDGASLVGVFQDATELKTAERAMLRLNETLELRVAECTAERNQLWGMHNLLVATAGFDTIFREVSPGWGVILGWPQSELTGRSYIDFVHPDDVEDTLNWTVAFTAREKVPELVNRYRHKDGSYRWIGWTVTADQEVFYTVGRDVTDQKQQELDLASAQEALRQAQKMEAVGQLTGGLAHDFNNLLTGMMGNLELLQLRVARGRLDDLDRFINAAQGAGRRAASLTQRLLAFSRRQTLDPKPTDVNRLIAGLQDMLHRTVGATVDIEVVGAAGLWTADIDAGQLENAILNLCINGRDAMPDGGKLTIETANKWLDDRAGRERDLAPGQYISICVTDTGTGMSAETIARAFEPFYTTKPIGQGTGLGLSMIYGFAKQSGGQVRVYSELGQGTTVCVYLPRHHGDAGEAIEGDPHALTESTSAQTVLVVDDEATIRHLIDEVLDDLGYTVIGAADGAAGIKVLQSGARIELLITDVGLPNGMNGRQVADAARSLRPGLKVLFITGFAENAAVGNGHLEPGMELLTKPFTLEALSVKVAEMLKAPAS